MFYIIFKIKESTFFFFLTENKREYLIGLLFPFFSYDTLFVKAVAQKSVIYLAMISRRVRVKSITYMTTLEFKM